MERDPLDALADRYRAEGYEVRIRPKDADLPAFLANSDIDILARKGEHLVALKANQEDPSDPDKPSVLVAADLNGDYGASLLAEAERLLSPDTVRAALALAWAAVEAAARDVLRGYHSEPAKLSPEALLEALLHHERISMEDFERLRECLHLRTAVVHGVRPEALPPEAVMFLLGFARRLLEARQTDVGDKVGMMNRGSTTLYRPRINQDKELKGLVSQATELLVQEILGPSGDMVSMEWDQAEDAAGRPVVTLTLSDLDGRVTGTFDRSEFRDRSHMFFRLSRLWGDLLQVRSHKQLQSLLGSTGEVG